MTSDDAYPRSSELVQNGGFKSGRPHDKELGPTPTNWRSQGEEHSNISEGWSFRGCPPLNHRSAGYEPAGMYCQLLFEAPGFPTSLRWTPKVPLLYASRLPQPCWRRTAFEVINRSVKAVHGSRIAKTPQNSSRAAPLRRFFQKGSDHVQNLYRFQLTDLRIPSYKLSVISPRIRVYS